jgi:hypothetical protein
MRVDVDTVAPLTDATKLRNEIEWLRHINWISMSTDANKNPLVEHTTDHIRIAL